VLGARGPGVCSGFDGTSVRSRVWSVLVCSSHTRQQRQGGQAESERPGHSQSKWRVTFAFVWQESLSAEANFRVAGGQEGRGQVARVEAGTGVVEEVRWEVGAGEAGKVEQGEIGARAWHRPRQRIQEAKGTLALASRVETLRWRGCVGWLTGEVVLMLAGAISLVP
jgi:hypothetical protein